MGEADNFSFVGLSHRDQCDVNDGLRIQIGREIQIGCMKPILAVQYDGDLLCHLIPLFFANCANTNHAIRVYT